MMNTAVLFLSKDFFYIYDQTDERMIGKSSYRGEFTKNEPKIHLASTTTKRG